jgi:hypothetical protein
VALVRELAGVSGLVDGVTAALADTYRGQWVHAPGRVFCDLACAIADGATSVSDIRYLADRETLHGAVASMPTAFRLLQKIDAGHAEAVTAARDAARAAVWAAGAGPDLDSPLYSGWLHIDMDATISIAHSEKENAAATWKKTFGFHPLFAFLDRPEVSGGEALAGLLRPGNAGSNTTSDHITVLEAALAALPAQVRPGAPGAPRILVRTDSAGATYGFAAACRRLKVGFSLGFDVTVEHVGIADRAPSSAWSVAIDADGVRDRAWVAEITGAVDLSAWPVGTRLIVRKERPHPGAQLTINNTTADGCRLTAFITDTPDGMIPWQVAGLELRHRRHARVEDRIRESKNTGLGNLPLYSFSDNAAWLLAVLTAIDLIAWTKLLCFPNTPGITHSEIATFRYRVLHVAARITRSARCLTLNLDQTWPWAASITAGWIRLRNAFP